MRLMIDMDGVLVDIMRGLEKEFDILLHPWPKGAYNPAPLLGFTTDELWHSDRLSVEFWKNLHPTQECTELMSIIQDYNYYILTQPVTGSCAAGKMWWIWRNLPKAYAQDRWIITSAKYVLATPDTILIDDCDNNIKSFQDAGGRVITFPRPWNKYRDRCDKPMEHVISGLEWHHAEMQRV